MKPNLIFYILFSNNYSKHFGSKASCTMRSAYILFSNNYSKHFGSRASNPTRSQAVRLGGLGTRINSNTSFMLNYNYSPNLSFIPSMAFITNSICSSRGTPSPSAPLIISSRLTWRANSFFLNFFLTDSTFTSSSFLDG